MNNPQKPPSRQEVNIWNIIIVALILVVAADGMAHWAYGVVVILVGVISSMLQEDWL